MPKPETKSLEERVHEAIHESVNPLYIASILEKDDTELLSWLSNECDNNKQVISEAFYYLESDNGKLELGTRILRSHLRMMLFFLTEFRNRRGFEDASIKSE